MAASDVENGPTLVTNASDDEKSLVKSQRKWDSGDRVSYGAHIFWMSKEFGWVLLIPEICLPCGALAAVMIAYGVIVHCYRRPLEEVVIEIVMCIWLWNNVLWMASEVLFDEPDVEFPWNFCPVILGEHQSLYYHLSEIFKNGFLLGVAVYVLGILVIFYRHRQVRGALGEVLLQGYLCSWCLKDYFWAAEKVWPALSTDLITVPMLLYHIHLQSGIRSFTGAGSAWIVWALANAVWILGELEFPGVNGFNFASASLLFVALILLICGYASYKEAEQKVLCNETSGDESSASGSIQLSCMSSQSSAC